ncbi:MAG: ATP-binding protein [Chlorobi bacterium]|nr:ATP-binding protein [Chlorobiota bacterium]
MIKRELEDIIISKLNTGKAIIILGPRQTGKTTLLNKIASAKKDYLLLDCDNSIIREQLSNSNIENLRQIIGKKKLVFIDEAQRVKNIGITLKIITDQIKSVQLLVSGSSALEIANEINEPLTGRKWEYMLYPIGWKEFQDFQTYLVAMQQLEQRIIYGMYPEVITDSGNEIELLKQLSSSNLYKDLLSYGGIRKPEVLEKLLRALALQIGNEVSYNELARLIQIDKNTVMNYIDLLEKAFVIYKLQPLSRNMRTEISSSRKIYFYDTGIRNAIISNFSPLSLRQDTGALWENFMISERMKYLEYNRIFTNRYFWRSKRQQEIDYIEERGGKLFAYEFKWNPKVKVNFAKAFLNSYKNSETKVINKDNFMDFLL